MISPKECVSVMFSGRPDSLDLLRLYCGGRKDNDHSLGVKAIHVFCPLFPGYANCF